MRLRISRSGGVALALAIGIGTIAPEAESAARSRSIVPTDFLEALELTVEGKKSDYWSLDPQRPVTFTVRGPGRVKIITRLAMGPAAERGDYTLVVREEGEEVKRGSYSILPATGVEGAGFPAWGRHRDLKFDVPAGSHTYEVRLAGGAIGPVAVRPRLRKPRARPKRLSMTPDAYDCPLTLVRDEKEITYYRLTTDVPVKISILGPTELQITTRLDFDQQMKGGAHGYALEVCRDGDPVCQTAFRVTRSQVSTFRDRPEIVPGIAKSMTLPLDDGLHELEVHLKDTVAESVALKFYLPADDVN